MKPQERRSYIGGSDASAVLGLSPYKTPFMLWQEKVGILEEDIDPSREKILKRGARMEPYIREMVKEEHDIHIVSVNQRYTDAEFPFLSCEVDFQYEDTDGVQNADIKTASIFTRNDWGKDQGDDDIPVHYTVQFLFGQMVTGRNRTLVVTLLGLDDLRIYRVERDEEMIQHIRTKCVEFWQNHVIPRFPPPITSLEDAKLAWPKDNGQQVKATPELIELVEKRKLITKSISGDEAKLQLIDLDITKAMKDATELVSEDGKKLASWKLQKRKSYTVEESEFRVLRVG